MRINSLRDKLPVILGLLLMMAATGFAQEVRYNYVPGTNFANYRTYEWVELPERRYPSQIVDSQIKQAIDKQLALKGLRATNEGIPDIYLVYQVAIDQQTEWTAYSSGGVGWGGIIGWGATSSTINIGTLVLDFYDVAAKKQVWTGSATKQLNPSKDPAKNQKNLEKAMAKLLKNYPPPPK